MKNVSKILMVCLGNICRSPLAEAIMREKLKQFNLPIAVDSAGTSNYHIGENPDSRSIANAAKNGIDISQLKARQFSVHDFDQFDLIYVMDESNYNNVTALARDENDSNKVRIIMNEHEALGYTHVPDPYFGKEKDFQLVFDLLDKVCEKICRNFQQQLTNINP
jgi:protein-tyrosine phosphatase